MQPNAGCQSLPEGWQACFLLELHQKFGDLEICTVILPADAVQKRSVTAVMAGLDQEAIDWNHFRVDQASWLTN